MSKLSDVIAQTGPDKNWDEETMAQQKAIEDEIAKAQPLVGDKQSMTQLEKEYNEKDSGEFLKKAKELGQRYPNLRRVRGDGNCFYRAVAFAQLERLMNTKPIEARKTEFEKFRHLVAGWKDRLVKLSFPAMTTEDFCDSFVDTITKLAVDDANEALLVKLMNTDAESDYVVVFMRLITGGYLMENEETYGGFVDGARGIKQYVEQEISPMYRECDHLCVIALSKALNIPIRIEYMDRGQAPAGGYHHDFKVNDETESPVIFFLYRPGHYDILYPKETAK